MAFPVREGWSWCPKMFNLKYWGGVNWALCSTQSIAHLPSFRELVPNTFFILSRAISVPVITPIMFTWKRALLASCKDEISIWQCYIYRVQGNCFNQFAVTEIRTSRDIYRYDIGHCDLWRRKNAQSGRRTSSTVKCKKYLTRDNKRNNWYFGNRPPCTSATPCWCWFLHCSPTGLCIPPETHLRNINFYFKQFKFQKQTLKYASHSSNSLKMING